MKKLKLKEVDENTESIREFLETKPKLVIVKNILSDAIVFSRLSGKMEGVLNVFHPKTPIFEFNLKDHYWGISTACNILKVKDQNLDVALTQIYFDLVCSATANDCDADDLAVLVLFQWLKEIKKYKTSYRLSI
ncbi:MAG: hypothetical protein H7Z76_08785 [Methylotenera sp.]|nr:hypothetical protein [Flavobacterium sp.]